MKEEIKEKEVEALWLELEDIPFYEENNKEMHIDQKFYIFEKGTPRIEIWEWFNMNHSNGIYYLLYEFEAN